MYIHQNPLRAGLVTNLKDYKYSSYPAYLSTKNTMIKKDEVLVWFGGLDGFITDHKAMVAELSVNHEIR